MKEFGKEQPQPFIDTLVESTVSKFKGKEFYLAGPRLDEKSAYGISVAVDELIRELNDPVRIFKELVKASDLNLNIENYGTTLDAMADAESWEEVLNLFNGAILEEEVVKRYPELIIEDERRWMKYEED